MLNIGDFFPALAGRIWPRYRTFDEWIMIYGQIVGSRGLGPKTIANRRTNIRHLTAEFGARRIGSIRPHELATWLKRRHATAPVMARRILIEAREIFDEALGYGWIDSNPAQHVRQLPAPVKRKRMALPQWQAMFDRAESRRAPWVRPLLALALLSGQRRGDLVKMAFSDVWPEQSGDRLVECLHVHQQKTGARIALPLDLRLDVLGMTLGDAVEMCRNYGSPGPYLLRKSTGASLCSASLSVQFRSLFDAVHGPWCGDGTQPSLHEVRSLSERLFRAAGISTRHLLGHRRQSMTDVYNDDRGLSRGNWQVVPLPGQVTLRYISSATANVVE